MRRFKLVRFKDVTGQSGTGIIGEGATCTGGGAFLHWMTDYESFVYWPGGVEAILAVHGHEGATIARYLDDEPKPPEPTFSKYPDNSPYDDRD
jgi:hypothetical protein